MHITDYIDNLKNSSRTIANQRAYLGMTFKANNTLANLINQRLNGTSFNKDLLTITESILADLINNNCRSIPIEVKAITQLIHLTNHMVTDDRITLEIVLDLYILKAQINESTDQDFIIEITSLVQLLVPNLRSIEVSESITDPTLKESVIQSIQNFSISSKTVYDFSNINRNDIVFTHSCIKDYNLAFNYLSHSLFGSEVVLLLDDNLTLCNVLT
jgi:hypothetical protein